MAPEHSFHRDAHQLRDVTRLDTPTLAAKARDYTFIERDPTVNPRRRAEAKRILTHLVFELTLRRRDGDAA